MATVVYTDFNGELIKQNDGDILKHSEVDAIKNSLTNIITTMRGSRRMLPEFAISIHRYLFEPIDSSTARLIAEEILNGIEEWDDRIEITNFDIEPRYNENLYKCRLTFKIKSTLLIEDLDFVLK